MRPRKPAAEVSAARRAAAAARWGGTRSEGRQMMLDAAAVDALRDAVPPAERRRVASDAIMAAARRYRDD